ncbi:MAG: hypothetical protein QNJ02_10085 [Desulfobacterales bacterium]|nr:hypothetical protein [Desulfobacterales bacterium]
MAVNRRWRINNAVCSRCADSGCRLSAEPEIRKNLIGRHHEVLVDLPGANTRGADQQDFQIDRPRAARNEPGVESEPPLDREERSLPAHQIVNGAEFAGEGGLAVAKGHKLRRWKMLADPCPVAAASHGETRCHPEKQQTDQIAFH